MGEGIPWADSLSDHRLQLRGACRFWDMNALVMPDKWGCIVISTMKSSQYATTIGSTMSNSPHFYVRRSNSPTAGCANYGRARKRAKRRSKFGVPKPVSGSQPGAAGKPCVPQPGFVPFVTSLKAWANIGEYNCKAERQ